MRSFWSNIFVGESWQSTKVPSVGSMVPRPLALLLSVSFLGHAAGRVVIHSAWWGLGPREDRSLSFTCVPNFQTAKSSRCVLFRRLLSAIDSPFESTENLFGITPAWLAANVQTAINRDVKEQYSRASQRQIALFRTAFLDSARARARAERLIGRWGTDDYPSFVLEAEDSDGARTIIRSDRQAIFMLPWEIESHGRRDLSIDRGISDAITALLPKRFPNRDRIGGAALRPLFSEAVLADIKEDWDRLRSEDQIRGPYEQIGQRFQILKSSIVSLGSVDVGDARLGTTHGWESELRDPRIDYPLTIGLFLPFEEGQQPVTEVFLRRIEGVVDLVTTVPWLKTYAKEHPEVKIHLRFVGDRSFSIKANKDMVDDLRRHGQERVAEVVEHLAPDCAFLEVEEGYRHWSRWVVLPDRRSVLWHFQGSKALIFEADRFRTWDFFGFRSAGAVVSPDGELITLP